MVNWQIYNDNSTITVSDGTVSFVMVKIPGGGYWIGETPVTQELWEAVMGSNPSRFASRPRNPVENVSWNDATSFIARLNEQTSLVFRLPTLNEWEYAARGGSASRGFRYAGSDILDEVCWYSHNSGGTRPVKEKRPNEIGLYDMLGNVMEWCNNGMEITSTCQLVHGKFDVFSPSTLPHEVRFLKGGSWMNGAYTNTIKFERYFEPHSHFSHVGFRLALSPAPCQPEG